MNTVPAQKHDNVSVKAQIHGRWGVALHGPRSGTPRQRWESETGESPKFTGQLVLHGQQQTTTTKGDPASRLLEGGNQC